MAKHTTLDEEEAPKSKLTMEEERLVQIQNEKTRLEKEIDILHIRYEDRQRLFQEQSRSASDKFRVDLDKIQAQLVDNKAREERLIKTQSEVNQIRSRIEKDAEAQKRILLEKEVALDKALKETADLKAQYAAKLTAKH